MTTGGTFYMCGPRGGRHVQSLTERGRAEAEARVRRLVADKGGDLAEAFKALEVAEEAAWDLRDRQVRAGLHQTAKGTEATAWLLRIEQHVLVELYWHKDHGEAA